ncbi:MAG: MMPL family transporter [Myxococcales bacterium]|nr:MAG: MMPL family transporter [Myxococcales bacterium]
MGSIVIGNGVNPNIIWLARYFEERRKGKGTNAAIAKTHYGVWGATLTASLAAALAYGSLTITDFRGFRDFGIIGSVGMALCWIGSMVLLPALVRIWENYRPLITKTRKQHRAPYGIFFANLIYQWPKTIVTVSALFGFASIFIVAKAISDDPLEYDINKLRSVQEHNTTSQLLNDRVNEFLSRTASGTVVIIMMAPSPSEAQVLEQKLEKRRDEGKADYGQVRSIYDFLPDHQQDKQLVLADIRKSLLDIKEFASDKQQKTIQDYMPHEHYPLLRVSDLPEALRAPFRLRDGSIGRLIFIEQSDSASNWDGRYLVRWSNDIRAVRTSDNQRPPLAGRPPIFADMLESIWQDGPLAIAASLLATALLLLFAFNRWLRRLLTLGSLLLGILWMGASMALAGIKLNFLNFVAFPITFGNGVDYGVNVMRRYAAEAVRGTERVAAIRYAVEETGGAVVLCSLTTVIGYMSLYASSNQAINSFGAAMAISEVTCLFASVLTMPAIMLLWRRYWNKRQGQNLPQTGAMERELTVPGIITPGARRP